MTRKIRSDCTVGTFEKKHGLPDGTIRNNDGRDTRSNKKIATNKRIRYATYIYWKGAMSAT